MSTSTTPSASYPSPTDTSSSSSDDSDDDMTGDTQYYNYFFLLLAVAFLALFLFLLLLYFRRRRKLKDARLQQHGRAALAQDVSRLPSAAGLWSWHAPPEPPCHLNRIRSACNDSILEAGLDQRGEAPPPYKAAAADIASPMMSRREMIGLTDVEGLVVRRVPVEERIMCRSSPMMPPDYHQNATLDEGLDVPGRPDAVVTVAERVSEVDLEAQLPQDVHPLHPNRIPPKVNGRWGSMRRLMSSTESTV